MIIGPIGRKRGHKNSLQRIGPSLAMLYSLAIATIEPLLKVPFQESTELLIVPNRVNPGLTRLGRFESKRLPIRYSILYSFSFLAALPPKT